MNGIAVSPGGKKNGWAPPTVQLAAAQFIIERGWGKAPQALHVNVNDQAEGGDPAQQELEALEFVRSRIASIAARLGAGEDTKLIEHEGEGS